MAITAVSRNKTIEASFTNALAHFLPITVFPLIFTAAAFGGWWLLGPILFFMAAGPMDLAFGKDGRNMDPKRTSESQLLLYSLPVWLWAVLWPTVFVFTLWHIFIVGEHAVWESIVLALILAVEGQAIFIVGHELIHRRAAWERYLGEFILASGSYSHYATEHFYIHHAYVGTPLDSGSALKGQSFWRYLPPELFHNLTGSWAKARMRMTRRSLPVWHYGNPFWRYGIETALWYGFVYAMGGFLIVLVYLFLCFGAVFSMKVSNYIQHYGLRRIRLPNGRFERVQPWHAWSSNYKFSKWMFFNYQRHADHHVVAGRQYPMLQHYDEQSSPQLPDTYGALIGLALRPKRWFETMDPLVDQWREQFYPEIKDWSAYDSVVAQMRPEAFEVIAELYESAPRLATAVEKIPELLDSLQSREFTDLEIPDGFGTNVQDEMIVRSGLVRLYWTREFGADEMKEQLAEAPVQDCADAAEIVRNWSNDKTFQVGIHTIRGYLSPTEAGNALANIAEASIATVLKAAVEDIEESSYQMNNTNLAAIVLGELASEEVASGLQIELLLLHDNLNEESYTKTFRRFCESLGKLTSDSLLFAPMTEPSHSVIESALADLPNLLQTENSFARRLALTCARCIFKTVDSNLPAQFDDIRKDVLFSDSVRRRYAAKLGETEMTHEIPELSLRDASDWGLMQIEVITGMLQLSLISYSPDKVQSGDAASIISEAKKYGLVDAEFREQFLKAAALLRNLVGIQRLILEDENKQLTDGMRSVCARACGQFDYESLLSAVTDAADAVRNCRIGAASIDQQH